MPATSGVNLKRRSRPGPSVSKNIRKLLQESIKDDLIISPHLEKFLVTWDGTIPEHIALRIAKTMSTPDRDRSGSWSASSAGKCLRRQELQFLGMPPNIGGITGQQNQIFNNGRWVHLRMQATLLTAGLLDGVEVTVKKRSRRSRCTLDGVGVAKSGRYAGREFGFELKGRNDWVYNTQLGKGPDEQTRKQVDFEFLHTGFDLFVILNENKNNQAWHEWVIVRDEERIREMANQVKELNRAIDNRRLHPMLPECAKQLKSGEFWECPFGRPGGVCVKVGTWPRGV